MKKWIKLYTEIVDDPKMGRLTSGQFRTCINLFLLAGIVDGDGLLPSFADIAWKLRMPERSLAEDLAVLAEAGIVEETPSGWLVSQFGARQAPPPSAAPEAVAERVRRWRQRQEAAAAADGASSSYAPAAERDQRGTSLPSPYAGPASSRNGLTPERHAPETPLPSPGNERVTASPAGGNAAVTPAQRGVTRLDTDTDTEAEAEAEAEEEADSEQTQTAAAAAAGSSSAGPALQKLRRRQVYELLLHQVCRRYGWWAPNTAWLVAGEAVDAGHTRETARAAVSELLGTVRGGSRMTNPTGLLRAKLRGPPVLSEGDEPP